MSAVDATDFGGRLGAGWAVGAVAALNGVGFDAHQSWAFARADLQPWEESPFRCENGERATMAFVRTLPPTMQGLDRIVHLATGALAQLERALRATRSGVPVGVYCGLPERFAPGAGGSSEHARDVVTRALDAWLRERNVAGEVFLEPRGHASFARACQRAHLGLAERRYELAIVGGVDTYYDRRVVDALIEEARIFDLENLDSFIPGEGAAFALLGSASSLRSIGLSDTLLSVDAAARAEEPSPMLDDTPCLGQGLSRALRAMTSRLQREARMLDWVMGDVTNEHYRAHEYQLAFPRSVLPGGLDDGGKSAREVASESLEHFFLPRRFGDLGAATMPTALAFAAEAFQRRAVDHQSVVIFGSSVGGERGAILATPGRAAS